MSKRFALLALAAALLSALLVACGGAAPPPARLPSPAAVGRCATPACPAPPLAFSPRGFSRARSGLVRLAGAPRHRGRDQILRPGEEAWVIGKFAYGPTDKDLEGEEVDVFLLRGCAGAWEKVGTFTTSVEGEPSSDAARALVADTGGRIFVNLSARTSLPAGRHRVRMVVAGDGTAADLFVEVLPPEGRVVVTDVDGTLTESEFASWRDVVGTTPPAANPGAATLLASLVARGYRVVYLTARPEWLVPRTRAWLDLHGFPAGTVRTTLRSLGAIGEGAADFKTAELATLARVGQGPPAYAFGNMPSDVDAYARAGIPADRAFFYRLGASTGSGVVHDDYRALLARFEAIPPLCR